MTTCLDGRCFQRPPSHQPPSKHIFPVPPQVGEDNAEFKGPFPSSARNAGPRLGEIEGRVSCSRRTPIPNRCQEGQLRAR